MEQPDESQANQGYQNEQQIKLLERQAIAAEKLNRLTCAAIVVTFLTLFIIGGGLWVSKRAADAAKSSADAQIFLNRAWVMPDDWSVPDATTLDKGGSPVILVIRNIGQTPAVNFRVVTDNQLWNTTTSKPSFNDCPKKEPLRYGPVGTGKESRTGVPIPVRGHYSNSELESLTAHSTGIIIHGCLLYDPILVAE